MRRFFFSGGLSGLRFGARARLVSPAMLALALAFGLLAHVDDARAPAFRTIEANIRDGFMRMLASDESDPRVALVDIDEDSLQQLGAWPWPRQRLADLAEQLLSAHRVRLVVFDLVLPEPAAGADAIGDARLAALAAEGVLVPAQAFDYVPRDPRLATGRPGGAIDDALASANGTRSGQRDGGSRQDGTGLTRPARATGHVANFAAIASARCLGNVGFLPDFDGQVRRLPLITEWQGRHFPTLALAALQCATGGADSPVASLAGALEVDADGHWRVPFGREPGSFLAVPALDLLAETPGLPALDGRIVLVGSSALGLSDRVATPLSPSTAGVTVHATALSAMLDRLDRLAGREGPGVAPPPGWLSPAWLLLSTLLLWWAIAHGRRLRATSAALAVAVAGWAAISVWTVRGGASEAITPALWAWACLLLLHLPVEWAAAQARIRARTRLLSRYVARPVLDELLRTEEHDPLTPRHSDISVLIADMQDYTRITAYSTLEEAAALTRDFLDCLTRPVLEFRGTLDKYTGDGMVAFWGAPLADPQHAERALDAALAIHAAVARYNAQRVARGDLPVRVRIGLASGRALVGDLGTTFRSTYTAVGDVINLASRLQQAARDLDCDIVASRALADALMHRRFLPVGAIAVRGLAREEIFTPALDDAPAGRQVN